MRTLRLVVILLAAMALIISCGGDGGTPADGGGGQAGNPDITLSVSLAMPLDRVDVSGMPANATGLFATITTGAGTTANAYVERRGNGTLYMLTPLHPDNPVGGGVVEVRVTDGAALTSNPVSFEIDSLPPASGPVFSQFVDGLQTHFDAWLAVHGTTRNELGTTPVASLPATHLPLLMAYDVLDSPDNPNSLRATADGPVPYFNNVAIDFDVADRLLDRTGVSSYLDSLTAGVDSLTQSGMTLAEVLDISKGSRPSSVPAACLPGGTFGITSGSELDGAMEVANAALGEISGASGRVLNDVGAVAGALGLVPGLEPHAAAVGGGLWVYQKMNEAAGSMLPSAFNNSATDFDLNPAEFNEDDPGPGSWSDFRVTAMSAGWSADKFVLDAIMQLVGMQAQFTNHLDQYGEMGEKLSGYVITETANRVIGLTPDAGIIEVCPQTWADIDVTSETLTEMGNIVQGTSVVEDGHFGYKPDDVGVSMLRVETKAGHFGNQAAIKIKPVEVKAIDVDIIPGSVTAQTDEIVTLEATVSNAQDMAVDWVIPAGLDEIDRQSDGRLLVLQCPSDPWSPAFLVKAFTTSTGGIRGRPGAPERNATATISNNSATVLVDPTGECLKPGETQAFNATVIGVTDQSVTWSTDPPNTGFFAGNVYNAPNNNAGTVVIIATSVADPNAMGYASVRVGPCECWWTAVISGDRSFYWSGTNSVFGTQAPGFISFVFETQVSGPGIHYPVITGFVNASAGATGTFQFIGSIDANDTDAWTPGDPDSNELPELTITSNDGTTIKGTASGPFFRVVGMSDPPDYEKLRLSLNFQATDGTLALCQD